MTLNAAAAASLAEWHRMIAANDLRQLPSLVHPQARFRSPMKHLPYEGAPMVVAILSAAAQTFEDFRYEREFVAGDGDVGLEFAARVGKKEVKGIDLIRFDGDGRIIDFEVMIRPASGLMALGEAMALKLGMTPG